MACYISKESTWSIELKNILQIKILWPWSKLRSIFTLSGQNDHFAKNDLKWSCDSSSESQKATYCKKNNFDERGLLGPLFEITQFHACSFSNEPDGAHMIYPTFIQNFVKNWVLRKIYGFPKKIFFQNHQQNITNKILESDFIYILYF